MVKDDPRIANAVTMAPKRKVARGPSRERVIPSARINIILQRWCAYQTKYVLFIKWWG
jgi:hypothetical protein